MQEYRQISISVTDPISEAIERTKLILFSPFEMSKWFVIGFCAFLAYLGQQGSPNFSYSKETRNYREIPDTVSAHLPLIITIAAIVVVLIIAFAALFCWLSSRGRFMFLHCVAKNVAEIKVPWSTFRNEANSLFLFRLSVGAILFIILALVVGTGFLAAMLIRGQEQVILGIVLFVVLAPLLLCLFLTSAVTLKFTKDFIVPIMYRQRCTCVEAWSRFWPVLTSNKGNFTLYILFQIVISIVISAIIVIIVLITCCIAGCLLVIPYIGSVLMLPLSVFQRSYSLCYIRQYSPQFNVLENLQQVIYES
ncbi:MAG: hypothetical protein K9M75_12090 [Phycisphaerae bacterium]|nr:hypothetical protein [Phycisphaerae bacterium]